MDLVSRLKELGLNLPEVARPVAAYVPARLCSSMVYTSGQLPLVNGQLIASGVLQSESEAEGAKKAAAACFLNALAAASQVARVQGVIRISVFVASAPEFIWQHIVANGASELALQIFSDEGKHARSAVGVSSLPLGASVEVEAIFSIS